MTRGRKDGIPCSSHWNDESGIRLAERYGFSTFDAMIAAAALDAGCGTLWSEDMQDGMVIEKRLRIVNPFKESGR